MGGNRSPGTGLAGKVSCNEPLRDLVKDKIIEKFCDLGFLSSELPSQAGIFPC